MTTDLKQRRGNLTIDYLTPEGKAQSIDLVDIVFNMRCYTVQSESGVPLVWTEITLPNQELAVE